MNIGIIMNKNGDTKEAITFDREHNLTYLEDVNQNFGVHITTQVLGAYFCLHYYFYQLAYIFGKYSINMKFD